MERKLAAILSADVVGYSRLMEGDEAGTLSALKAHRAELIDPAIREHHGRVIKLMGDGALVEFPSVLDAVTCAAAIQTGMEQRDGDLPPERRIAFRIGVHLGDVIVDGDDIYGDGVNVAARLEQLTAPGGVSLSQDAYRQVRGKTDLAFTDLGAKRLKNLRAPMRVYAIRPTGRGPNGAGPGGTGRRLGLGWRPALAVLAAIVLAGTAASGWLGLGGREDAAGSRAFLRDRHLPVVEVRAFTDVSAAPERSYLAQGLTQEFVAALGRFNTLWVAGPEQGGASVPTGVPAPAYRFEGSVQQSGARVRVIARLTDARTGTVRWSERHVGELDDLFAFQERMARRIAGTLATSVVHLEGRKRMAGDAPNASAFDLVLQARATGYSANRSANRRFRALARRAIDADPDYAVAHAMLAEALFEKVLLGWSEFPDRDLSEAERIARRAIELAPAEPDGHRALGNILATRGDYEQAQSHLARALDINPSDPRALAAWGSVQAFVGNLDPAVSAMERALKYNPLLEADHVFDLAVAYYLAGRHREALRTAEQGMSQYPDFAMFSVAAAAAAARLGNADLAERHAEAVRRRLPYFSASEFGSRFAKADLRADLRAGLRSAGL